MSNEKQEATEKGEIERLKNELFKANVENDSLNISLEKEIQNGAKAIDLLRSALAIAKRKGEGTYWEGFQMQIEKIFANRKSAVVPVSEEESRKFIDFVIQVHPDPDHLMAKRVMDAWDEICKLAEQFRLTRK